MEKLKVSKKYYCKNKDCKKFLLELKENGTILAAKNKGFGLNSLTLKITCTCGKEEKFIL